MQVLKGLEHNTYAFTIEFRNGTFQLRLSSVSINLSSMSSLKASLLRGIATDTDRHITRKLISTFEVDYKSVLPMRLPSKRHMSGVVATLAGQSAFCRSGGQFDRA